MSASLLIQWHLREYSRTVDYQHLGFHFHETFDVEIVFLLVLNSFIKSKKKKKAEKKNLIKTKKHRNFKEFQEIYYGMTRPYFSII